jgi:Putative beta-barrel porin-2, OmpL-like. bbp2
MRQEIKNLNHKEDVMKRIGMVLGIKVGLAVFCAMVALTATAFAEDPKPAGLNPDDLKKALGLSIYLQGGYTVNANASSESGVVGAAGSENNLRVFDHKANSFTLDLAQIVFSKDPAIGAIGYKLKLSDGETAKFIHARGMGVAGIPGAATDTDPFDVTEAYVSYTAPIGKGLRFDLGKMVTYFGAEVIEAIDNPNYSRSFLFNYSIPFTHTGLKMSYVFSDALNASFHVVNGWDNAEDNNTGKCVGVSVNYAPAEIFSGSVNFMTGPEQSDNNRDNRTLVDLVATIKPIKPLSIILNYDDAKEDHLAATGGTAKWFGFAGIVKYDINDTFSIAARGEYFDDKDGVRTGTVQKLKEMTLTFETRLSGGLILRPEYRHDSSNQESFENSTKKSQDTIALGALYRW